PCATICAAGACGKMAVRARANVHRAQPPRPKPRAPSPHAAISEAREGPPGGSASGQSRWSSSPTAKPRRNRSGGGKRTPGWAGGEDTVPTKDGKASGTVDPGRGVASERADGYAPARRFRRAWYAAG